jgi:NADH-quinone oxidoreductase subunit D
VLRVVLRADGELILEAVPHIGYLHRCAEKIGENVAPYQYIPYTDRMDYLAGMNNNQAFALAVEKLAGLEGSRAGAVHPHDLCRVEPHRLAPGRGGYLRAGHGRVHAVSVLLSRAGDDPRSV